MARSHERNAGNAGGVAGIVSARLFKLQTEMNISWD